MKRRNRRPILTRRFTQFLWGLYGLDFVSVALEIKSLQAIIKHSSQHHVEITLEKRGKYFDWDSLWWNLCARRRFAFWVVFTTLCREWRCWPRSLFSLSSRSALGRNALVSLRGEHQSHTTSFLHFLQSERALHEVHKSSSGRTVSASEAVGCFIGATWWLLSVFWTGIWEGLFSAATFVQMKRKFYCKRKWMKIRL